MGTSKKLSAFSYQPSALAAPLRGVPRVLVWLKADG
jgi:hypothetical protein